MSRCSRAFDDYLAQLQQSHTQRLATLRADFEARALALPASEPDRANLLKTEYEELANSLQSDLDRAVALLNESYEHYLETLVPAPAKLPVLVTVVVPSKNLTFDRVMLQPTDTPKEMRSWLQDRMAQRDPISEFTPANIFALYKSASDFTTRAAPILLTDESIPVMLHNPEPGAVIALQGHLRCLSDAPKRCFRYRYVKDSPIPQLVDYYTCRDCRMNWICPECAQLCHVQRGHVVTEYMKAHSPSWGCCYCLKGGGCTLIEKQ